jgi:DNA (cytosine-5)-methyltransferase 1
LIGSVVVGHMSFTSVEICAGAGGQAIGLERAGFNHAALVELDPSACQTLRLNRPKWNVIERDVRNFDGRHFVGVDLLAGGVPCPPFSKAGKQLGEDDERDLFPVALRLVREIQPSAVMLENVRGLFDPRFDYYRESISINLATLGYRTDWRLLHASNFGVPQLRPRVICVAMKDAIAPYFAWPEPSGGPPTTVGETLLPLMMSNGWKGAAAWAESANLIAPTLVGGSKKHGGADLGPSRAKKAWGLLGVDGHGLADTAPDACFEGMPRLTVPMAALVQGFPQDWRIWGKKTAAYRQVGNAFPPPVAEAVGKSIKKAIQKAAKCALRATA